MRQGITVSFWRGHDSPDQGDKPCLLGWKEESSFSLAVGKWRKHEHLPRPRGFDELEASVLSERGRSGS